MAARGLTREDIFELSEALDPEHRGGCWPDPVVWDGRPLEAQAEDLLLLADAAEFDMATEIKSRTAAEVRIVRAAERVRAALGTGPT